MPFNDRSQLDPSQVNDRRGRGMGKTVAIGGGGLGYDNHDRSHAAGRESWRP